MPLAKPLQRARYTQRATFSAVRTVIVHVITDAFDLDETESTWITYHVMRVLEPIEGSIPKALALPVKRELETGYYSQRLVERMERTNANPRGDDGSSLQASTQDWAQTLADIVTQCYVLRPMLDASIVGQFSGLLMELGVGHPTNPRASLYLPNAVRATLNS